MNREWTLSTNCAFFNASSRIYIRDWYFRCQDSGRNFSVLKEFREISHTCNKIVITLSIITGKIQSKVHSITFVSGSIIHMNLNCCKEFLCSGSYLREDLSYILNTSPVSCTGLLEYTLCISSFLKLCSDLFAECFQICKSVSAHLSELSISMNVSDCLTHIWPIGEVEAV